MSDFARIHAGAVAELLDLDPSAHAAWVAAGNPKAQAYRPVVSDPLPIYDPTIQVVEPSLVVEPSRVRRAWTVRPKTADERRTVWTSYEFLQRFTSAERRLVWSRAKADDDVAEFLMFSQSANEVQSDDPATVAGMNLLVAKNILTPARRAEILS